MSSFGFHWSNPEKPSGKVFARKRNIVGKVQTKEAELSKPSAKEPAKSPVQNVKRMPFKKPAKFSSQQEEPNRPASKFIKRKQRKDKLAAKIAHDNEETQPIIKPAAQNTSNVAHSLFSVIHKNIYVNTNIPGSSVVEKVFSKGKSFSDLSLHKHLISNLEKNGFTSLTNVQEKAIPLVTTGRNVLIRSQTGSGKTLAYAVPIVDALQNIVPRIQRNDGVQAIIVVPTRELAIQTHELFGKINTFQWIVVSYLCGGENRKTEKDRLRKGVHVLIGTPGRLLDHMLHTTAFKVDKVRCLVLDEADRLLDMGFKKDLVRIVEELDKSKVNADYDPMALLKGKKIEQKDSDTTATSPLKNPNSKNRQTILLSATLNKSIAELADFTMKDHIYVDTLEDFPNINPGHMVIPNTVEQQFIMTYVKHRLFTLSALLLAKEKHKVFVFMATSQMVDYHYELFTKYLKRMPINRGKIKSGGVVLLENEDFEDSDEEEEIVLDTEFFKLHGSMDQGARKQIFKAFRAAKRGILLCTDVAARGVDVPEADCIIQYTGPQSDEDYLHRVGRTGRAGKSGSAIIFLTHEEQEFISRLQEHKVFLKKCEPEVFLKHLCDLMEQSDQEKAATLLQRRFETAIAKDADLHRMACFAYSSWSRFYNTYPGQMKSIFNFKTANLGHYVTSFALKETPSGVARVVRGQVTTGHPRRLNKKLATHSDDQPPTSRATQKRKIRSVSLATSEFASAIEPSKKKKKKQK